MNKSDSNAALANASSSKNNRNPESFSFEIDISEKNIFVIDRILSGKKIRNKVTNKFEWSYKLNDEMRKVFHTDCSWSFKHADAYANGDVCVKGYCSFKECSATIEAHAVNNQLLRVKVNNYDKNIDHCDKRRRRTTGTAGKRLKIQSKRSSVAKVQNDMASDQMMEAEDDDPPHMRTLTSIQNQINKMFMDGNESSYIMHVFRFPKANPVKNRKKLKRNGDEREDK